MNNNVTQMKPNKLTESEADSLMHDAYLVQIREQSCHHCQSGEQWSELFEVWTHPTKTHRTAAYVLRPTVTLRAGYDVSYTRLPTVVVPVCSDCIETYNPEHGSVVPAASHEAWKATLLRKYAPVEAAPKGRPETPLENL